LERGCSPLFGQLGSRQVQGSNLDEPPTGAARCSGAQENVKPLQWHEPAAYRRAIYYENERRNPLDSVKLAGIVFAVMCGLRFLAGLGPESHPPPWPPSAALALGVALIVAYGLPGLMSLMPGSMVILSDKGLNNNVHTGRGWSIRFWPWDEIDHCSTAVELAGGKTYDTISFWNSNGELLVTLALKDHSTLGEVGRVLQSKNKQLISGS